ncbi:MAG: permease-like cell division protein FtsX [Symbiobacterium sp.]|uniref:permease-like cell division protein FtsX n=1 Tax=Symbiobacterium sp. TaxID=1971213 RepID=UPI0034649517
MSLRGWVSALRDALHNTRRGSLMSLASVLSVAVTLLVLAVVSLLAVNLEYWAATAESQVEIKGYLCTAKRDEVKCGGRDLTQAETEAILERIRQMPDVVQVTFLSRHEALEQMKQADPSQAAIFEGYEGDENPLSDEVYVKVRDVELVPAVAEQIQRLDGVAKVDYGKEIVADLLAFTRAVRIAGLGLVLLLLFATVLTLSNTIRLSVYARRREVSIMKLVGATDWYIRRPFVLEGMLLGAVGAGLAGGVTAWGYMRLAPVIQQSVPFLPVVQPSLVLADLVLGLLLLGAALGAVGSYFSLRRFLKV